MSIRIETTGALPLAAGADTLVAYMYEDEQELGPGAAELDQAMGGRLAQLLGSGPFKAGLGDTTVVPTLGLISPRQVVVAGLGTRKAIDHERARRAVAAAVRAARAASARTLATELPGLQGGQLTAGEAGRACAEGALLGLYRFDKYRSAPREDRLDRIWACVGNPDEVASADAGVRLGETMAAAANFARDLANEPPNVLHPAALADAAAAMCSREGLQLEVLGPDELTATGMGALLGVARGSARPPRLLVIRHAGALDAAPLALVGKGVTFDTGGISLKPAQDMENMKYDMSGAAAVLGAMLAVARLRPARPVLGIVGAVENMPGGGAQRPGDIVRSLSGKTIEIINTDAEGRLVLADAVAYAARLGAGEIVDVATLTGACVIALGKHASGLLANNESLAQRVAAAAEAAGERVWQLPSFPEYRKQLESHVADLKNTGGRPAGAITGGQFIGEFAGETPWAHLDIAGTSNNVPEIAYWPVKAGATGVMARTLAQLALADG